MPKLDRYLLGDFLQSFLATLIVLLTVSMGGVLVDDVKILLFDEPLANLDPATGKVSFSAQTETYSKHAYALGQSTTPPAPFSLTPPDLKPPGPDNSRRGLNFLEESFHDA